MRILFITAFYPPHVIGGWEQLIEDINSRLKARSHQTHILTSFWGFDKPSSTADISRVLHLESDLQHYRPASILTQPKRLRWNLAQTEQTIKAFRPDVVFIQIMWNLSRGVPWTAERLMAGRVVYYMPSVWAYPPDTRAAFWVDRTGSPIGKGVKSLLGPVVLRSIRREHERFRLSFDHILCVSEASRTAIAGELGRSPASLTVVNNGVELDRFYPRADWPSTTRKTALSLLFAGTVAEHKGVHTAVEAMNVLKKSGRTAADVTLAIAGSGHEAYEANLKRMVQEAGLSDRVNFLGRVPREDMPVLMRQFDVLLLPSIWEEPLARVMQEAMASGLLVIGTNTGGTGEVLIDQQTGLVFPPGDASALARCIETSHSQPELRMELASNGRQRILEHFSLDRMVDEIEEYLSGVITGR